MARVKSLFSFPEVFFILPAQLFYTFTFSIKSQLWHFICPEKWMPFLAIKKMSAVRHEVLPPLSFMPGRFSLFPFILAFPFEAEGESLSLLSCPAVLFTSLSLEPLLLFTFLFVFSSSTHKHLNSFYLCMGWGRGGPSIYFDSFWNYCVSWFISRDFKIP